MLIPNFQRLLSIEILPTRFIKFSDFMLYGLNSYFKKAGLYEFLAVESKVELYPFLVRLFFTNLTYEDRNKPNSMTSLLLKTPSRMPYRRLSKILTIPYEGFDLTNTEMTNETIFAKNFQTGQSLHI